MAPHQRAVPLRRREASGLGRGTEGLTYPLSIPPRREAGEISPHQMRRSRISRARRCFDAQGQGLFLEGARTWRTQALEELERSLGVAIPTQGGRCGVQALDFRWLPRRGDRLPRIGTSLGGVVWMGGVEWLGGRRSSRRENVPSRVRVPARVRVLPRGELGRRLGPSWRSRRSWQGGRLRHGSRVHDTSALAGRLTRVGPPSGACRRGGNPDTCQDRDGQGSRTPRRAHEGQAPG